MVCAEKSKHSRLTAILCKTCFHCWSLADIWELGFGRVPTIHRTAKSGSLCLYCRYKQCLLCWTPAFLLAVWNLGTCKAQGAYVVASHKNSGPWVSNELLSRKLSPVLSHSLLWELSTSSATLLGEDLGKLVPDFSWTSPPAPFCLLILLCILCCNKSKPWAGLQAESSKQIIEPEGLKDPQSIESSYYST